MKCESCRRIVDQSQADEGAYIVGTNSGHGTLCVSCANAMATQTQLAIRIRQIEKALGDRKGTRQNPCGAEVYYDDGEGRPWRIADDQYHESYASFEQALAAARTWNRD